MATAKKPVEPKPQITLIEALQALIEKHGSQANAAVETGINKTYFSRMVNGIKDWPSDETLVSLGLRRNVSYSLTLALKTVKQPPWLPMKLMANPAFVWI